MRFFVCEDLKSGQAYICVFDGSAFRLRRITPAQYAAITAAQRKKKKPVPRPDPGSTDFMK